MWVERPDAAVIFYFLYCMGACIEGHAEKVDFIVMDL